MGKCLDCKHWKPFKRAVVKGWGDCKLLTENPSGDFIEIVVTDCRCDEGVPDVSTHKDFGCILFEEGGDKEAA